MNSKSKLIGFIGLGNLGSAVAERLISQGFRLIVKDLNPKRVSFIQNQGAEVAQNSIDFHNAEIVFICLPGDSEVLEVILDAEDSLLATLKKGTTLIILSTIMPSTMTKLKMHCDIANISIIDAPVSGGPFRALEGNLTVMVGGDARIVNQSIDILNAIGNQVHHLGPVGAGEVAKFSNQLVMFATLSALYEAQEYAAAFDMRIEDLLKVFKSTTADSWVAQNWGFFAKIAADYDANGTPIELRPWGKDLLELLESAEEMGLELPLAKLLSKRISLQIEGKS
jgi:2-hydroxy-3-oxopropionate reductase